MKTTKKFKENALLVVLGVVLFWVLTNYELAISVAGKGIDILKPVIMGAVMAFVLNVPMSAIEKHLYKEPKNEKSKNIVRKLKRPISITLTFIICIGIVVLVCVLVIPALVKTISQLSSDIPVLVTSISEKVQDNATIMSWLEKVNLSQDEIIAKITSWLKDGVVVLKTLDSTVGFVTALFSSVVNFIIGLFFAIYMLAQKERLKSQGKRIFSAFLKDGITQRISRICRRTIDIFGRFLMGQCTEAVILGSLCCIGMLIFGFPNAIIIAVLVSCTALIPIVGAFLGFAVGFLLICVTSFKQAVWYLVFMLILQQIEGNLIYPRVVGNSVGLPALWTLFAITVGGNMFGILGMFLAVPVFSVIYVTLGEVVAYRNEKKESELEDKNES